MYQLVVMMGTVNVCGCGMKFWDWNAVATGCGATITCRNLLSCPLRILISLASWATAQHVHQVKIQQSASALPCMLYLSRYSCRYISPNKQLPTPTQWSMITIGPQFMQNPLLSNSFLVCATTILGHMHDVIHDGMSRWHENRCVW